MTIFAYIVDFYNEIEGNTTTEHGYICGESLDDSFAWFDKKLPPR